MSFLLSLILAFSSAAQAHSVHPLQSDNKFVSLCYHDVSAGFVGNAFSVRKKDLVDQFDYLKAHYNIVSLQDILDASHGKKTLPPKAVLLTFDDGLASFYENVYPLLKTYKFKAVFGVVGKWIDDGAAPDYGFKDTNPKMASWKQLKEMSDSGFVDVVSHTYDMHQGLIFNPQGSQAPMAGFFQYDPKTKAYETEEAFSSRVFADLQKNEELIKKHIGKNHPVIIWPYGAYNNLSIKAAESAGLPMQFTLRAGLNNTQDLSIIHRGLILADMDIAQFAGVLETAFVDTKPLRMIRVDLDSIWKKTETESEQQLGDLLEQTLASGVNGVLLQAVTDSGAAYFATSKLPVRGDYLNRATHTLKSRALVADVYARMPVSVLKNTADATAMIRDLTKFTDIDGIFFEVSPKENIQDIPFESFETAARAIRPHLRFGLIGQKPVKPEMFDFVMLPKVTSEITPQKLVISLPQDFKSDAAHMIAQGYLNLYYDVNFKGFVPDTDFRNVFSVRQSAMNPSKGEAK